jgi:hypothetical protein
MMLEPKEDSMSHVDEGTIHAYIDGELPALERAAFDAHIEECATCRARLGEERALAQRASQLLSVVRPQERPAPPLDQLRVSHRSLWGVRMPFAWAASIALALSIGYYMREPGSGVTEPEPPARMSLDQDRATAPAKTPVAAPAIPKASAETRAPARQPRVALRDSAPPASVAIADEARDVAQQPQLNRAPLPAAGAVAPRIEEQPGKTEWPFVSQDQARQMLGAVPVGVPSLPVRGIRRNPAGDGSLVVEQELDATTVIQLFQRSVEREQDAPRARELASAKAQRRTDSATPLLSGRTERLARFVGSLRVEIAGPLPQDSLNRLLEQVKPLP